MMQKELIRLAKEAGILDIGFVTAEVANDLCLSSIPEKKMLSDLMPEYRTVIVGFIPYYAEGGNERISRYARGKDYHIVVRELLSVLADFLEQNGFFAECFCDSWIGDERRLAEKAGLGFIGENHMLIHPEYGSYGFLGCILTDCELMPSKPLPKNHCDGCGACRKNCPGGALGEDGFCLERCASHLTQLRRDLTDAEAEVVKASGMLWGCDRCQEVCPHNRKVKKTEILPFLTPLISELDLVVSERSFRKKYAEFAFSWRGKKPLERNEKLLKQKENS